MRTESVRTIAQLHNFGGGKSCGVDVPLNAANCGNSHSDSKSQDNNFLLESVIVNECVCATVKFVAHNGTKTRVSVHSVPLM